MLLYAIISAISAVLALFLPETRGTEIPDTLDEVEKQNCNRALDQLGNEPSAPPLYSF